MLNTIKITDPEFSPRDKFIISAFGTYLIELFVNYIFIITYIMFEYNYGDKHSLEDKMVYSPLMWF